MSDSAQRTPLYNEILQQSNELREDRRQNLELHNTTLPVSDFEYNAIRGAMANSQDPQAEAYRWAAAITYAREFNTPLSDAIANIDVYNNFWTGEREFKPTRSNWDSIYNSFKIGQIAREQSNIARQWMEAGGTDAELERKLEEYTQQMEQLQDYVPRHFIIQALKDGAQTLPFTAAIVATGAIATATAGLLAPAAASVIGAAARLAVSTAEIAPMEYYNLRKNGIDHETAKNFAMTSGVVQAAVETLLGTAANASGALRGVQTLTGSVTRKLFTSGKIGSIAKAVMSYTGNAIEEGVEEAIQELVSAGTLATAAAAEEHNIELPTNQQRLRSAWEAATAGFRSALVLGVGASVGGYIQDTRQLSALKKTAQAIPSREAYIRANLENKPEGMTDEQWRSALVEIHEKNQAKATPEDETRYTKTIDAEGINTDESDADTGGMIPTAERRTAKGELYTQRSPITNTKSDGSIQTQQLYGDPISGARYGFIEYSIDNDGSVEIEGVKVRDGYQYLRKEMLQDFIKQNPDSPITWNPDINELIELKNELVTENPRGEKAGLTYWTKAEPIESQTATAKLIETMKKELPQFTQAERIAGVELISLAAKQDGLTADQWIAKNFMPDAIQKAGALTEVEGVNMQGKRGAMQFFAKQAKAVIYVTENSDFSTWTHELAHVFRKTMNKDLQTKAATAFGVQNNTWTRDQEEAFAVGFEEYLRTGKAENEAKKTLFQRMAAWLQEIYKKLAARVEISPEIKQVYDELLGLVDSGVAKAELGIQQETEQKAEQAAQELEPGELADDMLFQDDKPTPEAQAAFESAIENFGLTKSVYEAGYVLPDGRMLDFSGRSQATGYKKINGKYVAKRDDYLKNDRQVDHREVRWDGAPVDEQNNRNASMDKFIEYGAIRIDANAGLADMASAPTAKQWEVIKSIIQSSGTAWVEMKDGKRTATIEADGKPTKALGYIRRFYEGEDFEDTILFQEDKPTEYQIAEAANQIEAVREQYQDTEQWMKAPNGQPTKLNERQWLQVRTPAFKDWFGDWENDPANASKVIDENGEPLVVYHGTAIGLNTDTGERKFDGIFRRTESGIKGPGIYFASTPEAANVYAMNKWSNSGATIIPVFINITDNKNGDIFPSHLDNSTYYKVVDPNQIKSATGNRGSFSQDDPSILFQATQEEIETEARTYETWQAWMQDVEDSVEFMGDQSAKPEGLEGVELAAWYKDTWERANQTGQYATDESNAEAAALTEDEKDKKFSNILESAPRFNDFLKSIGSALYVSIEGMTTEDPAGTEQALALQRRIRIETPPLVQMAAQRALNGEELSASQRKAVRTNIENNIRGYRALYAEVTGDTTMQPSAAVLADIPIDEPTLNRWETMSFEERKKVVRKIKNEEIKRKIATGKIQLDGEIEQYIDSLQAEEKKLQEQVDKLDEELKEEFSRLSRAGREIVKIGSELHEATKELARKEREITEGIDRIAKRDDTIAALRQKVKDLQAEYNDALKSARREAAVQTALAKKNAISDTKAEMAEKYKERDALRKFKETMIKTAKGIMAPVNANVDYDYRVMIEAIQSGLDPHFRRALPAWVSQINLDELQDKWEKFPDIMRKIMPKSAMDRLDKKPLNEWTLEELEEIAEKVESLRAEGRQALKSKQLARKVAAIKMQNRIIKSIIDSKGLLSEYATGSAEEDKEQNSPKKKLAGLYYATIGTARKAMMLDGDKKDAAYDALIYRERAAYKKEQDQIDRRKKPVETAMKDLGITLEDLYQTMTLQGAGPDGGAATYTYSDLLYAMIAAKEEKTRDAVAFGNLLSIKERKAMEGKTGAQLVGIKTQGYSRLEKLVNAANGLDGKYLKFAETIAADFKAEFDRINEVSIREFNMPVQRVGNYVPMHRMEMTGDDLRQAVASDWLNTTGGALPRNAEKGFTKKRIEIAPSHQRPIKLDLFGTWTQAVEMQEHFINYAEYSRELTRIFKSNYSNELRMYIKDKFGRSMLTQIDDYINEVANPSSFKKVAESAGVIRKLRGNVAPAYLGWKLSSVMKQVVTSPLPFLSKLNPLELSAANLEVAAAPGKTWEMIAEKSAIMRDRTMDVNMAILKEQQTKAATSEAERKWKRFQAIGMKGLELADRWATAGGWLAMYRKTLAAELKNGSTEEQAESLAVRAADDLVANVQPSGRIADLAPLFKESKGPAGAAMQVLTQFQTSLNVMWQQMTYDIPVAIKQKKFSELMGTVTSLTAAGILLGLMEQGLPDDEDDEERFRRLLYYSFAQYADTIPLIGREANDILFAAVTGEKRRPMGDTLFPAMAEYSGAIQAVTQQDWEKAVEDFAQGVGLSLGAPISGVKEAGRILSGDIGAAIGRRQNQ